MYLLAGATSSGKSTFLNSEYARGIGLFSENVIFAHQIASWKGWGFPKRGESILHYNLMRPAQYQNTRDGGFYNFYADPAFKFIEKRARNLIAIIIVAKEETIFRRVGERTLVEPEVSQQKYPSEYWRELLDRINLHEVYERFSLEMERLGIPCHYYMSTDDPKKPFKEVHRYATKSILQCGDAEPLGEIQEQALGEFEYQQLSFREGVVTNGQNRAASLLNAFTQDLRGKTVLDVGSAIGALAFSAEQMGARHVVGLEPRSGRFKASNEAKRVIKSECEFYNTTLSVYGRDTSYDHVFILNVMHHMHDFVNELSIASEIATETLTIEFPGLSDFKYRDAGGKSTGSRNSAAPLIGVSLSSQDQTFVFSPEAVRRIVIDHLEGFKSYEVWQSPMRNRYFMRFYKTGDRGVDYPVSQVKKKPYAKMRVPGSVSTLRELAKEWYLARAVWRGVRRVIGK